MLAIAWQYLTGRAVATDPTDRRRAEWPPHPDRVLQSLVAAWGESGADDGGRRTLELLLDQPPPQISCPLEVEVSSSLPTFVPVNDVSGSGTGPYRESHLSLLPSRRKRTPRFFPAVNVGDQVCALTWPDLDAAEHAQALGQLCAAVTRIGHSSSLVRMWMPAEPPRAVLHPVTGIGEHQLRVAGPGRLQTLIDAYALGGPEWHRPPVGRWQAYARAPADGGAAQGEFDKRLLVLRRTGGIRLGLSDAPAAVAALRGLLIAATDAHPAAKRLVSGHEADGTPLKSTHAAILPLAFVSDAGPGGGGRHADGHLLGLAIALPRGLDANAEQEVLMGIAGAFRGQPGGTRSLTFGVRGTVEFSLDVQESPAVALRAATWARPSTTWASVTPVALDRLPPRRHDDHDSWAQEQIAAACDRQGLPCPTHIALLPVSPYLGAPAANAFPPLLRKDGTRRWHIHTRIRFPIPVEGPLALGAGRYRGYGLLRPLENSR